MTVWPVGHPARQLSSPKVQHPQGSRTIGFTGVDEIYHPPSRIVSTAVTEDQATQDEKLMASMSSPAANWDRPMFRQASWPLSAGKEGMRKRNIYLAWSSEPVE